MSIAWVEKLRNNIKGEVFTDEETLKKYSHDASIFEIEPEVVVFPRDSEDVKKLVDFVNGKKDEFPKMSLSARSAGTGMSGGSLSESIVVVFTKHFNQIKKIAKAGTVPAFAIVEPGVYYRDFEKETLKKGLLFPSYPASKSICAMGGIVSNNSGGEKSLKYGKTNEYVRGLKVVLSDGNEYEFKKLNKMELQEKKAQSNFEGSVYRKTYELLEDNFDIIQQARPKVSKNSAGYYLWNIWDRESFDLTQLFCGSQGTLGIITEIELGLIQKKKFSKLLVVFLKDTKILSEFTNVALRHDLESLETFDDNTLKLAMRFLPDIAKHIGGHNFFSLAVSFIGEAFMALRHGGIPKFVVLAEMAGDEERELDARLAKLHEELEQFNVPSKIMKKEKDAEKYFVIRRESFNLLRHRIKDKMATPFIDDIIVEPDKLPEFLPKLYKILEEHEISPTLAGHAGSGNFHIIPLMDLSKEEERAKIPVVSDKVYDLVLEYGGSITAEHNDGLIRSPYLEKMYGAEIYGFFEKIKEIFDPKNIFNPGKKVGSSIDYAMEHIKRKI